MAISLSDLKNASPGGTGPTIKLNLSGTPTTQLSSPPVENEANPPQDPSLPFTLEELQFSNAEILKHQHDRITVTYNELLKRRPDYLCVYSDGVLREHSEENGALKQIPILITNI